MQCPLCAVSGVHHLSIRSHFFRLVRESHIAAPTSTKTITSFRPIFLLVVPGTPTSWLIFFSRVSLKFQSKPSLLFFQKSQDLPSFGGACSSVCKSAVERNIASAEESFQAGHAEPRAQHVLLIDFCTFPALSGSSFFCGRAHSCSPGCARQRSQNVTAPGNLR